MPTTILKNETIQAEVRLYFQGRADWDTEFFEATSHTDLQNKALEIAKRAHADHSSYGPRTAENEYKHLGPVPKVRGVGSHVHDQVAAIEGFLGMETKPKKAAAVKKV
jgi:hypothetical protein